MSEGSTKDASDDTFIIILTFEESFSTMTTSIKTLKQLRNFIIHHISIDHGLEFDGIEDWIKKYYPEFPYNHEESRMGIDASNRSLLSKRIKEIVKTDETIRELIDFLQNSKLNPTFFIKKKNAHPIFKHILSVSSVLDEDMYYD